MPLDTTTYTETKPDLSKPSLEALAYVLRHREEWPIKHKWNFRNVLQENRCGTSGCAMGIGNLIWQLDDFETELQYDARAGTWDLTMSDGEWDEIFYVGACDRSITPEVVASRIDDHLAGRPIRYLIANDRG